MVELRTLVLVLGDQLDCDAAALDGFDAAQDAIWMAEVAQESTHVPSSHVRTVMFLAAMRHFAQAQREAGRRVHYQRLDGAGNAGSLACQLEVDLQRLRPACMVVTQPGDWRVLQALQAVAHAQNVPLEVREDRHFYCTLDEFKAHAHGRRQLRMEHFYRQQRQRHRVLMRGESPEGGQWNFDTDNREAFPASGPGDVPRPAQFSPDAVTRETMALVQARFPSHPGHLAGFAWPVTRAQALQALTRFVQERLPLFGRYQDALWPGQPWLYHAHLSAALNLKLLNPREVVAAAVAAYEAGHAPLASVEGFVRQILGWREYVRGIYWLHMPQYQDANALDAHEPLPEWYWSGATDMVCLRDTLQQTLTLGYAHHIQRLMVTGLFALLLGVKPQSVHAWYLAVYVDAVEWVELPNTLGMSQFADGGLMASKPYVATGQYIARMGPHCQSCQYRPAQRVGTHACPFTTLYWDFLMRHEALFANHPRMALQVRNLARLAAPERQAVRERAAAIRRGEVGAAPAAAGPGDSLDFGGATHAG